MNFGHLLGQKISGFELVEELGSGTSAAAFAARNPSGKQAVAKRLFDSLAGDTASVDNFLAASESSSKIRNHKFLTKVLSHSSGVDGVFLLREYVEGEPLSRYVREGRLNAVDPRRIAQDLCDAVRAMATRGVVHGGIHPGNVIITPEGRAKLTDFGTGLYPLARKVHQAFPLAYPLQALRYLSPEQWQEQEYDTRADIYAVGLILATLERGGEPFDAGDPKTLKAQILAGFQQSCPVIAAAIDPTPARRYPNVDKFRNSLLQKWQPQAEPQPQPAPPPPKKPKQPTKSDMQGQFEGSMPLNSQSQPKSPKERRKPKRRTPLGSLGRIFDVERNVNLLENGRGVPFVELQRKKGARRQYPLRLVNTGDGALHLQVDGHGRGISVNQCELSIEPNAMASLYVYLQPDSAEWLNVAFRWKESGDQREVVLRIRHR